MEVVAIILTRATLGIGCCGRFAKGQAPLPAVVCTSRQNDIVATSLEGVCKKIGTSTDVEIRIAAIPSRCATTFLLGDLHQALLTGASDSVWVASAFLHSERGEDDSRDTKLAAVLLEKGNIGLAGFERTVRRLDGSSERDVDQIRNLDVRGIPATFGKTTVEPVDATVRATRAGGLFGCTNGAAIGLDIDEALVVSRN